MTHEIALKNFRKQFYKEFQEFPQLEYLFENMFNAGYSAGLEYLMEGLNKNKK